MNKKKEPANWNPQINEAKKLWMTILDIERKNGVSPSEYKRQMLQTTEERIACLTKSEYIQSIRSILESSEDTFQAMPPILIFQNFSPGKTYNAALTIRNVTKQPRSLKVFHDLDPFVSVEFRGSSYSHFVAPGLAHTYNVKFCPEENLDYFYQAKFITDTVKLTVPIIAIGPRPILDFPDIIEVPVTAVKLKSTKSILIRNVGSAPAIFSLYCDNTFFWIEPSRGIVEKDKSIEIKVNFLSSKIGDFHSTCSLTYDSEETLRIDIRSSTVKCLIEIDTSNIQMEETYLGMSRSKVLTIRNKSDYVVHYKWMRYKDEGADEARREEYMELYGMVYNMEIVRSVDLLHYNICTADTHELICQRIYRDEVDLLKKDTFPFTNLSFLIVPESGTIWPRASVDVTVFFRALSASEVASTAYLEATGQIERIPLNLCGVGKGPILQLNVITIDMKNIYLCSLHHYEVVAANTGLIKGTLVHKPRPTDFGGSIKITPQTLSLKPEEYKSFNLTFTSKRKGQFIEKICFLIKESEEMIYLHIKGCIICPTLQFDKDSLNFGATPLGYSQQHEVNLQNKSSVPVTFNITIPDDGIEAPLFHEEFAIAPVKPNFPHNPREFRIKPYQGVVAAHSSLKLNIVYTANIARKWQSDLKVDMWDSDSNPIFLPITFSGEVAKFHVKPKEISIKFCFINFPYSRNITIENSSAVTGYFYFVPQEVSETNATVYSLSTYQGYLEAHETKLIKVTIMTRFLGKQFLDLSLMSMGEESPVSICKISCNGQGPVISVEPASLDFGEVRVLMEHKLKFSIINDSPIPAHCRLYMAKQNSPWSIVPTSCDMEANSSMEIELKLFLHEIGKYNDSVLLSVVNSRVISFSTQAFGIGCSIAFKPEIEPIFDMGLILSHQEICIPINMINMSSRPQQIFWSNVPTINIQRGHVIQKSSKKFQIHPVRIDLLPGKTSTVQCRIHSKMNETIIEDWYIFGCTQGEVKREIICTSTFKATFIEPKISFSKQKLVFHQNMSPADTEVIRINELFVRNESQLDLHAQLNVGKPFGLITEESEERVNRMNIILKDQSSTRVRISFSPTLENVHRSKVYKSFLCFEYQEHPSKDKLKCRGYLYFPNVTLSTKSIAMNCVAGCSAEESLILTNVGPVPVQFSFNWINESITIHQDDLDPPLEGLRQPYTSEEKLDVQDGSGDAPSIIPAQINYNTPTTIDNNKLDNEGWSNEPRDENNEILENDITAEEIKSLLLPLVAKYFSEDREIPALENLGNEPSRDNYIHEILDIVPSRGMIPAYSSLQIYFIFNGLHPIKVQVVASCKVENGPTKEIRITACSDTIGYYIDKTTINFGTQLFCESAQAKFTLSSESMIPFSFRTETKALNNAMINLMKIIPDEGILQSKSFVTFEVFYYPLNIGPFETSFDLQVGYLPPISIRVIGIGILPQVYIWAPRIYNTEREILDGYRGISRFTDAKQQIKLAHEEGTFLDWCIVPAHEFTPTSFDVEMASERFQVNRFIQENIETVFEYSRSNNRGMSIPSLLSQEYSIDLSHIIINVITKCSIKLTNYGPMSAEIKLKKVYGKSSLENSGILLRLEKNLLLSKESSNLQIICHPIRTNYPKRINEIKHVVYLEVTNGCTLPLTVKGLVTYPYITVNTNLLKFENVVVGECLMMKLLMENSGLETCNWEAKLSSNRKREEKQSFFLEYNFGTISPGQKNILHIYFRPRKPCYIKASAEILVKMGLESLTINLIGHGVENNLIISEPIINFLPTMPSNKVQEEIFQIENNNQRSVEYFWHHLDNYYLKEIYITDILLHYYGVEEILLPHRKPGERISEILIKFYDDLCKEMTFTAQGDEYGEILKADEMNDETLQVLLHKYIDNLQKDANFYKTMKDPVEEIFEKSKTNLTVIDPSVPNTKSDKKAIIIFHGAPCTMYQETACRVAKIMDIPLLDLNKFIVEVIALDKTDCGMELRKVIDETYVDLLANTEKLRLSRETKIEIQETPRSDKSKSSKGKSDNIDSESTKAKESSVYSELLSKLLDELKRIPTGEKLEKLDLLSQYDYKIEAIQLLQKIMSFDVRFFKISGKISEKSGKQKDSSVFLGINIDLFSQVIEKKLTMSDFNRGFILQSLNNIFIKDEIDTLLMLLPLIGHVEYALFITFLNDIDKYINRQEELNSLTRKVSEEDVGLKVQEIDEMSLTEYDNLPEEIRKMYLDTILPQKRQDALKRRTTFLEKMSKVKKTTSNSLEGKKSNIVSSRNKKSATSNHKSELVKKQNKVGIKMTNNKGSSKADQIMYEGKIKEMTLAMNNYYFNLENIESILHHWNPAKKIVDISKKDIKVPKPAIIKEKPSALEIDVKVPFEGFHLWYVKAANPWEEKIYDSVIFQIKQNNLALSAILPIEPQLDLNTVVYSVFSKRDPQTHRTEWNGNFRLYLLEPYTGELSVKAESSVQSLLDSNNESLTYKRKKNKRNKKQKFSSTSLIEGKLLDNYVEEAVKPRWIMQANEIKKFKIQFLPEKTGVFEKMIGIGMDDCSNKNYSIKIRGVSDIPRVNMNPNIIFSRVHAAKASDVHDPAYFTDNSFFDFGSILVMERNERVHYLTEKFKFYNISEIDARIHFSLAMNNVELFKIEPEELTIKPNEVGSLLVSVSSSKLGLLSDRLVIRIDGNPNDETIELRANGSKLDITLDEKELSFNRVLLYRKEFRTITIYNNSLVSIFWSVQAEINGDSQITWTPTSGVMKALSEQKIEFCYHAATISLIDKKKLFFKAFLYEDTKDPIFTETIFISGESYDVFIHVDYANPIDLKNVKVGCSVNACFVIKNSGPSEVKYVVTTEKKEKLSQILPKSLNLKKCLNVQSVSGMVGPQKAQPVHITFTPKDEFTLKECPILTLHILDSTKHMTIVAEFPLTVSLVAYYTRYRIYPNHQLDFGSLGICTAKTMHLNIENIGRFPLEYSIHVRSVTHRNFMEGISDKKDLASSRSSKSPQKKDKSPTTEKIRNITKPAREDTSKRELKIGSFIVEKIEGELNAGQIDSIPIACCTELVGKHKEEIMVLVPNSVPQEDQSSNTIKLIVHSCIPSIDFQDKDAIFYENYIIDHIQDFKCPRKVGPHSVFARKENCLYFCRVPVWKTHFACFKLYNKNVVPADVKVTLMPDLLMPKNAEPDAFSVKPETCRIPSMSFLRFTISFTPNLIEIFRGQLEVSVDLPDHLKKDERFVLKLIGESCMPEIVVVEPPEINGRVVINFKRILVGEIATKEFIIENVGLVQAKVIIKIDKDDNSIFRFLHPSSARQNLLLQNEDEDSNNRVTAVCLLPEERGHFKITFCPKEIGKNESQIRIHVVDNPYENVIIPLEGEGYFGIVILEGLESRRSFQESSPKETKTASKQSRDKEQHVVPFLTYELNCGPCFINRMYKRSFKIVNKSEDRYFRFNWTAHPDLVIEPTIGHLKPLSKKSVTATFLVSEPKNHMDTCIDCELCEIKLMDNENEISWDDRQTIVRWENKIPNNNSTNSLRETLSQKVIELAVEPSHEVSLETTRTIEILFNAIVNFSEYSCNVSQINFKDILMYQVQEHKFSLENTGLVDIVYSWKLHIDDEYPTRPSDSLDFKQFEERRRSNLTVTFKTSSGSNERSSVGEGTDNIIEKRETAEMHQGKVSSLRRNKEESSSNSCKPSDLFSSSAEKTDRTTDSWFDSDVLPFTINPEKGTIKPGESIEFLLRFAPLDVLEYKIYLTCKMENLHPKLPELIIPIKAKSLLPYCHFDIPVSDYLTNNRRDPILPGPDGYDINSENLLESIKVIELDVIGVGETHIKKFYMINPTIHSYRFSWINKTSNTDGHSEFFRCITPDGIAEFGKRTEISFSFLANNIGTFESFWLFNIEQFHVKYLFLFVAVVREPSVYCLKNHVKMKPTVLGIDVQDFITLFNNEEFPIPYQVLSDSLYSEGSQQSLTVTPMCGVLLAKSKEDLNVNYNPTLVGEYNYIIQCCIQLKKKPMITFVTTTSYQLNFSVSYVNKNGETVLLRENTDNVINLGKIMVKQSVSIQFEINNIGNVAFYYTWNFGMTEEIISRNQYTISLQDSKGHVRRGEKSVCYLILTILQKTVLKHHMVSMKISRGPTYRIILKASAKNPMIKFNFTQYDFGPCYIEENAFYTTVLQVKNLENTPIILECKHVEKPHLFLKAQHISEAIQPNSMIEVPIIFRPAESTIYREFINFLIDSTYEKQVCIMGEGITYKISLTNPRNKVINFDNIPVGKSVIKQVPITNEGRAPIELTLHLVECENLNQTCQDIEETKKLTIQASLSETENVTLQIDDSIKSGLSVSPKGPDILRPHKKMTIFVKFNPMQRMKPFSKKVVLKTQSATIDLFSINASCIATDFSLNKKCIQFGIIVEGCSATNKVVLMNTGDIGARFKWNLSTLSSGIKITPKSGSSFPGTNVDFFVAFEPTRQGTFIENEVFIEIEKFGSLSLKISGGCCGLPEPIETIHFSTNVRFSQTIPINILNDLNFISEIKLEISGNYFTITDRDFKSKELKVYVTYRPIFMTSEDNPHKGTLIVKLPNGNAPIIYALEGNSLPPNAEDRIIRTLPAKKKYIESLKIYNWLNKQQSFNCKIEETDIKCDRDRKKNILYTYTGNKKIDIPACTTREYETVFYSYEEATFKFKVTFINSENEYQFYEIQYEVTKPEVIEKIKLFTSVRRLVCHILELENPLKDKKVTFIIKCDIPHITISNIQMDILPLSKDKIKIEYFPLLETSESIMNLDIICNELGSFPYELYLKANSPPPERTTYITAMIGFSTTFCLTLKNYAKINTSFSLKISNNCFTCPKNIEVAANSEGSFEVAYEPSDITNFSSALIAFSNIGGEFVFPIIGSYSLPKAQGPYYIYLNKGATITFKNVFEEVKIFELSVDMPEAFVTNIVSAELQRKEILNIIVTLREQQKEISYPVTGKLSVLSTDPKIRHVKWIYYLKGIYN